MKRLILLSVALVVVSINLLYGATMARAGSDFINVVFTGPGTCDNNQVTLPVHITWSLTNPTNVMVTLTLGLNGITKYSGTTNAGYNGSPGNINITLSGSPYVTYNATQPYTWSAVAVYKDGATVVGQWQVYGICSGNIATLTPPPPPPPPPPGSSGPIVVEVNTTCLFPDVVDGRLNPPCDDSAQTAAFYCTTGSDGKIGLIVYAVWLSKGFYMFHVSQKELDSVPSKPTKNTLVKAARYAQLYRLTTGELQLDTYTDRAYIFPGINGAPADFAQICSTNTKSYYLARH